MHTKSLILAICIFLACSQSVYAMDWKELHDRSMIVSSAEARKLEEKDAGSEESMYLLGLTLLKEYRVDDAWKVFERMEQKEPDLTEAQWGKAEVLRRRHRLDEAQKMFEDIIRRDPSYAPAYVSLGYMLFDKKQYSRSINLAVKVLRMGRKGVDLQNYTRAYLIIGGAKAILADEGGLFSKVIQGPQVLGYFKKAQRLQPDSAEVLFGLGSFYSLAPSVAGGDIAKGISYLERSIKKDPGFSDPYARLAQVWLKQNDMAKYRYYLEKARALDPQSALVLKVEKLGQETGKKKV